MKILSRRTWRTSWLIIFLSLAACSSCGDGGGEDHDTGDDDYDDFYISAFNFGLVHNNYYGDLGGYDGEVFREDQKWAANDVDLGIIGQDDEPMVRTWQEIRTNLVRGSWLVWQLAHLFNTNSAAGTCDAPEVGAASSTFETRRAEFAEFLADYPAYGDGEECFLHARHDGQIGARWHGMGCDITLDQRGLEGSAADLKDARLFTLVWDQYAWLFNLESDCARDFATWRAARQMNEGFTGPGYDNLGSPMEDGFYLPQLIDPIDVMEIPDAQETSVDELNGWYFPAAAGLLSTVRDNLIDAGRSPTLIFNGGSYCSWEGAAERLANLAGADIGVWCENALQYPAWGALDTPDRLAALIEFSRQVHERGGFIVLETFYSAGDGNPTPEEVLFYLAAYYVFQNTGDVFAIKPDWDPYAPMKDTCWFPIFGRDPSDRCGAAIQEAKGVFRRSYDGPYGQDILILVRVDGDEPPIEYDLGGAYQSRQTDGTVVELSGSISLASGDGLILIRSSQ